MKVLGVDPSLSASGVALLNLDGSVADLMTLKTAPKDGDHRLTTIRRELMGFIDMDEVVLAVREDLPYNAKSAGQTGMAQGVIRQALDELEINTVAIAPSTLKKFATGSGRVPPGAKGKARKEPMLKAFEHFAGFRNEDDNQVDAYFLGLMGVAALWQEHEAHGVSELIGQLEDTEWGTALLAATIPQGAKRPKLPLFRS